MNINFSLSNIVKQYGEKKILDGCTMSFGQGVSVIVGPHGCGKSTVIKISALLETPTSGKVSYFHTSQKGYPHNIVLMRKITLVSPETGLFNTSVWNNASYGLRIRRTKRKDMKNRTKEALENLGLYEMRKQSALTLSKGEARRLVLARALAIEPQALFLDEPTADLDEENTSLIEKVILALKKIKGAPTVVMTTTDRAQAERLADKLLVMKNGRFASTWTPPSSDYVGGKKDDEGDLAGGYFVDPSFFK